MKLTDRPETDIDHHGEELFKDVTERKVRKGFIPITNWISIDHRLTHIEEVADE